MNHYASYLKRVQSKKNVTATQDIVNQQGALVTKAGSRLNNDICDKIVKFKLLKPLEDSVTIEGQINADKLLFDITTLIKEDPWLNEIDKQLGSEDLLENCCKLIANFPIIEQKLTVLSLVMDNIYHQSLLSAYFSIICLRLKKRPVSQIYQGFMAGLIHDIGLLHIDQAIFSKKSALDAIEWRQMQSHPVIGFEILKRIDNLPKSITRAVLEHHESIDGSGYPRGSTEKDLSELGQLISLLDNVIAIYKRKFKSFGRSISDVIPIIQMSAHSYFPEVVAMTLLLLKKAPPSTFKPQKKSFIEAFLSFIQDDYAHVLSEVKLITETNIEIGHKHKDKGLANLQRTADNIQDTMVRSGLMTDNHEDWLKNARLQNLSECCRDSENMYLMLDEIRYQLSTYRKSARVYCAANENNFASNLLNTLFETLNTYVAPEVPETISGYWLLSGRR